MSVLELLHDDAELSFTSSTQLTHQDTDLVLVLLHYGVECGQRDANVVRLDELQQFLLNRTLSTLTDTYAVLSLKTFASSLKAYLRNKI